jgi:hypothetical protein
MAELDQLWNLDAADGDRAVYSRSHEPSQSLTVHSSRGTWTHIEVLIYHMRRPCTAGDQMADNVGVDALSHNEVRLEFDVAKGPA